MNTSTATLRIEEEVRLQKSALIIDAISTNSGRLITCATLVLIAYLWRPVLIAFAGKATTADIAIRMLGNLTLGQVGAGMSCAAALTWGWVERRLRKRALTTAENRIKQLELDISHSRSRKSQGRIGE